MAKRVRRKEVVPVEENATEIPTVDQAKPVRRKRNVNSKPILSEVKTQAKVDDDCQDQCPPPSTWTISTPENMLSDQMVRESPIFISNIKSIGLGNSMLLNQIKNTCSMYELGDVNMSNIIRTTRGEFENALSKAFAELGVNYFQKAIIYNCDNREMYKYLKGLGFKSKFEYQGYSTHYKVKTFVKETGIQFQKRSLLARLFS